MSRLDSFIRRMQAQRACLDAAAALLGDRTGHVLELGFGNGRTYDHLRRLMPGREIFVFDRKIAGPPAHVPDQAHAMLGDFAETLPAAARRLGPHAVLAHCDTGSGDRTATRAQADWLGPALLPLLAPDGLVLSDQPLAAPGLQTLPLPPEVPAERYFMYRFAA